MTAAPAPDLSDKEAATVARFGIFAEEELREKVAVAIMDADYEQATGGLMEWSDFDGNEQRHYRALAVAAIAALAPADETTAHGCCPNGQHACCCGGER